uniref:PR domain zinc finger protein 10 n=1 Tax=Lepisosteus oculatus TaxID=7918 RepID=W5LYA7_LEPOC
METKQEPPHVWSQAPDGEPGNGTQVHFEGAAVAQIVYSGEQQDRPQQQVVYTADGSSYTSVEPAEHTLVYIHPADGTQVRLGAETEMGETLSGDRGGTGTGETLSRDGGDSVNAANLHVLSNVAETPQAILEPVPQVSAFVSVYSVFVPQGALSVSNALPSMAGVGGSSSSPLGPLGATDSALDSEGEEEEDEEEGDDSDLDDWEPGPPRPFTPHDLWCEECNNAHPSVCLKHGPLHPIPNRPVLSKARASLPLVLYVDRYLGGVYSKRRIPKRTQFGPVEGPLVRQSELADSYIHLKTRSHVCRLEAGKEGEAGEDLWLDLSDEERCNWMMFVRPAQNHLEQNLVAYQYGKDIYYTTIKNIEPKQELKIYSSDRFPDLTGSRLAVLVSLTLCVLREQEKNWPCYECNRRFMSSEQLQQHLNMHDDKLDFLSRAKGRNRGRGRRRFGPGRRPGRPPKFMRLDTPAESSEDRAQVSAPAAWGPASDNDQFQPLLLRNVLGEMKQNRRLVFYSCSKLPPAGQAGTGPIAPSQAFPSSCSGCGSRRFSVRMRPRETNAALQHLFIRKTFRPFKCSQCGKAFREKDKLDQHLRFHGRDGSCPLTCHVCNKGFLSSAALEGHMRLHSDQKTYSCLFCPESFDRLDLLKEHVGVHLSDGWFYLPWNNNPFLFLTVKKHVRSFHSEKVYQCTECDKAFCRPDKLRLHMLRHSDRKDFLCSTCGKQFKRKDKLREHMQRMHNPEREAKKADRIHRSKTLKQKVPSTDFESFMFKCRLCMMGFRRRGMLVNHLSKRHPDMRIDEVPELTLPIIKPNRDYFCQYCDKVYKSASKRKAHILKNHPGAELPPSIRKLRPAGPGEPDPMLSTHTQLTGTIATAPVCCPHCSKQYSSKVRACSRLGRHPPPASLLPAGASGESSVLFTYGFKASSVCAALLSDEYRVNWGRNWDKKPLIQRNVKMFVCMIRKAVVNGVQGSQVLFSSGLASSSKDSSPFYSQVAGQPLSPSSQQATQELSPSQLQTVTPVTLAQSHTLQTPSSQQQGAVQHAYLPSNWNYRGYSSEIQMMTLPHAQYVIAETGAPVSAVNSGQVKTMSQTHYVISEGQAELDPKQAAVPQSSAPVHPDQLEPQQQAAAQPPAAQYIITTTTNGSGASEVHIAKP